MKNMTSCIFLLGLLALLSAAPAKAQTQVALTPYVGYNSAAGYAVDLHDFYTDEDFDDDEVTVRGGLLLGLGAEFLLPYEGGVTLKIRPSLETAFVSGDEYSVTGDFSGFRAETSQRYIQLSGDLIAEFRGTPSMVPYAGAGLAYARYSGSGTETYTFDGEVESDTEEVEGSAFGLNLLGGLQFTDVLPFGVPFVQLRVTVADPSADRLSEIGVDDLGTAISIAGGVSFSL